ncbi:MAG: rRNA maturation RNase YbeY [Sulfitobacter sp.]
MDISDISIEDARWESLSLSTLASQAISATLLNFGINQETAEISILACDDLRIAALNTEFRAKETPTNVLSWPSEERAAMSPGGMPIPPNPGPDGLIELGDIAISYDTCAAEARAGSLSLDAHVTHLIVHGTLHLLGFDHETEPDAALMEGLEVKILGNLGLDDPYRKT